MDAILSSNRKPSRVVSSERSRSDAFISLKSSLEELRVIVRLYDGGNALVARTLAAICKRMTAEIQHCDPRHEIKIPSFAREDRDTDLTKYFDYTDTYYAKHRVVELKPVAIIEQLKNVSGKVHFSNALTLPRWKSEPLLLVGNKENGEERKLTRDQALITLRNALGAHYDYLIDERFIANSTPRGGLRIALSGGGMTEGPRDFICIGSPLEIVARTVAAELLAFAQTQSYAQLEEGYGIASKRARETDYGPVELQSSVKIPHPINFNQSPSD